MKLNTALKLGRVSNLPTVMTNAVAGVALSGASAGGGQIALLIAAAALAYIAGMFLNDAFDAPYDALHQPYRPIPAGLALRPEVFGWGFALLAGGVLLFAVAGMAGGQMVSAGAVGAGLAGVIVLYNARHKENAFGPVLMGGCRLLVYVGAAIALTAAPAPVLWLGAALLMAHVMGLTYLAKVEGAGQIWPLAALAAAPLWGLWMAVQMPVLLPFVIALIAAVLAGLHFARRRQFGRAIPTLIAAIALLDAMLIASVGQTGLALLAALGFPLTLWLQKWVRGT
ncbi:UbiA family prenyltransferase [Ketogulonicigenium vulgare]|uniref:UbiA family prenyltransferase n=1 Tax=Ketogulonicigenium vulgare TaxID=92945 RepID=UPI00235965F6|nr:UbiA family prenyltransferase [Ketogulonicigenium vulgare]